MDFIARGMKLHVQRSVVRVACPKFGQLSQSSDLWNYALNTELEDVLDMLRKKLNDYWKVLI